MTAQSAEHDLAAVQATVEGVTTTATVELAGQRFRIAGRVGAMALMKFANAANSDLDTSDMAAMASVYDMLRDCIDAADWPAFERHAIDCKADGEELLAVMQAAMESIAARPTPPPAASPDGRPGTAVSSTGSSSAALARVSTGSPHGKSATSRSRH